MCPTEDAEYARNLGRLLISTYLTVPAYAAFHDWLGRGELLAPMHAAWAAGDRAGAAAAIPDEVVDALVMHGTPEECRDAGAGVRGRRREDADDRVAADAGCGGSGRIARRGAATGTRADGLAVPSSW